MAKVNVYLTFDGNCEEAFNYYKSIFGGEFSDLNRFSEMPPQEGMPPLDDDAKQKIMHVTLPISEETVLMASDKGGGWGPDLQVGNNFSISVNTEEKDEGEEIFNKLSQGGQITMPFEKTFWNAWFGMCTDKFGINWMVNCDIKSE